MGTFNKCSIGRGAKHVSMPVAKDMIIETPMDMFSNKYFISRGVKCVSIPVAKDRMDCDSHGRV